MLMDALLFQAFAVNCSYNTIDLVDDLYSNYTMGARAGGTFMDMKVINLEYCTGTSHNEVVMTKGMICA